MGRILALDIGDRWTGVAISDPSHLLARPFTTLPSPTLISSLADIITQENIETVVVGIPQTLAGFESEQTKKVKNTYKELSEHFSSVNWATWDERLTSKQAKSYMRQQKSKETSDHAIAASIILHGYLEFLRFSKNLD